MTYCPSHVPAYSLLTLKAFLLCSVMDSWFKTAPERDFSSPGLCVCYRLCFVLFAPGILLRVCLCAQVCVEVVHGREVCGSSPLRTTGTSGANHGRVPPAVVHARVGRQVWSSPVSACSHTTPIRAESLHIEYMDQSDLPSLGPRGAGDRTAFHHSHSLLETWQ